MKNPDCQ